MHGISSPAKLIEGIVPTLGYPPENSLVVAMVEGGALGAVMRVDLDWAVDSVVQLADVAARAGGDGAVAVVVSADYAVCPADVGQLIDALAVELRRCDTQLVATYVVDRIAAGACWYCGDGCGPPVCSATRRPRCWPIGPCWLAGASTAAVMS